MKRLETYFYDPLEEHKIMYKDAKKRPGLNFRFNNAYNITKVQPSDIITSPSRSPHPAFGFFVSTSGRPGGGYDIVTNACGIYLIVVVSFENAEIIRIQKWKQGLTYAQRLKEMLLVKNSNNNNVLCVLGAIISNEDNPFKGIVTFVSEQDEAIARAADE